MCENTDSTFAHTSQMSSSLPLILINQIPILYCQIAEPEEVDSDEEDEIDPEEVITEIKFVPDEAEILPVLYEAIQECTLLHPDSASDMTGT